MNYSESYPDNIFSHHVESFWQIATLQSHDEHPLELLLPTCTFNIIFTNEPYFIKNQICGTWIHLQPGASFIGQSSNCLYIKSNKPIVIKGIRFKPFAFANIIKVPIFQLNDSIVALAKIFDIGGPISALVQAISNEQDEYLRFQLINEFLNDLLLKEMSIDERLRAQLNYIMDRHGDLKISEVLDEFNTSKVTLRKHFINKVGLTPKKVAQIWRMNRVLQLKETYPSLNLTALCLDAGFFDQAHFIKDFRLLFGLAPKKFFSQNSKLIKIANLNISKRFSNQYDPRI